MQKFPYLENGNARYWRWSTRPSLLFEPSKGKTLCSIFCATAIFHRNSWVKSKVSGWLLGKEISTLRMANLIPLEKTSVNYSWKLEVIDEAVDMKLDFQLNLRSSAPRFHGNLNEEAGTKLNNLWKCVSDHQVLPQSLTCERRHLNLTSYHTIKGPLNIDSRNKVNSK